MGDLVQAAVSESVGNVTARSLAFGSNVTAGSTIVVVCQCWRPGAYSFTIGDSFSSSYGLPVDVQAAGTPNFRRLIAYAYNVTGGACTVTLTPSAGGCYYTWAIFEIPGFGGADPVDAVVTNEQSGTSSATTGSSGTLAQADEVAFALFQSLQGVDLVSIAVDSGFTQVLEELDTDTHQVGEIDYKPISSTTALNVTWTLNSSYNVTTALVTFKTTSAAPLAREQEGYRWRADDGDEDGATWLASQDTDITRAKLTNTRLRTLVNVTGDAPSEGVKLQYRKVGDPNWRDVS